ncbi:hypothetical protein [Mycolicibacterium austroafricanum]|uniref:hypothetical protein n=1 Tax=Mycolicibacterium austroafricanum TaxID=39687 RepID=UPI000561A580|nr:hypothetical protein [Mycolicibacterium austroafricanum]
MSLFGWLTLAAFVAALVFGGVAFVYVRRLLKRTPTEVSERIGSVGSVLRKLRKGEPISEEELDFAAQTTAERRSPMAYSIPAALFSIGSLYVFGKLDQLDGASPSWATFIGVLPMLAALNMTAQLHKIGHLNGRAERLRRERAR